MKQLLILIGLLLVSLKADAQNWARTNGPVEDDVLDLCIDSNGILYAVTPMGVNRSTDGGEHWTRPFLFAVSVDTGHIIVASNGSIIAFSGDGIFVSTDQGITFQRKYSISPPRALRQLITTWKGRLYAIMSKSPVFSDDFGEVWQPAFIGDAEPVMLASSHDTLIAHTEGEFFLSIDHGNSWKWQRGFLPDWKSLKRLLIHTSGKWLSQVNLGLQYYFNDSWYPLGFKEQYSPSYSADVMLDGSILISSPDGLQQLRNLMDWIDVSAGIKLNDDDEYLPITRFIQDRRSGLYYASSLGAGVWKGAAVLQSADAEPAPKSFSVSPNPSMDLMTVHFTNADPEWTEIELRNILGAIVWKKDREYIASGKNILAIEVPDIPAGNYLLVLRTNERTESQWVTIVK